MYSEPTDEEIISKVAKYIKPRKGTKQQHAATVLHSQHIMEKFFKFVPDEYVVFTRVKAEFRKQMAVKALTQLLIGNTNVKRKSSPTKP